MKLNKEQKSFFWVYHITEDHTKVCFSSKGVPALDPGVFGDFLCDSPYQLILSAFSYMKQADLQPEFIIWTGYKAVSFTDLQLFCDFTCVVLFKLKWEITEFGS